MPYIGYSRVRDATTRNGLSHARYLRPRMRRRRLPHYCNPRRRCSFFDRDRRFPERWASLRDRYMVDRDNDSSDSEPEEPDKPEVPPPVLTKRLRVMGLDFHIATNTPKHHTDMYECTEDRASGEAELVVRRGQPFVMSVEFSRPYNDEKNDLTLVFKLDGGKKAYKETFKVNETKTGGRSLKKWSANVTKRSGNTITLEVFIPASAPIGEWMVCVRSVVDVVDGKDLIFQYDHNEEINVICNPWCKEDIVYMPDDEWREEAVLNDTGAVYWGNYRQIGASAWHYGQFDEGILAAAFSLVRRGFELRASKAMGNAIRLARLMSTMVNSPDDNGVLVGNWSDDFSGGKEPTFWNGSVKILRQHMRTGKPVKYGQCWVFSAVLTTVCRALGIPCRSVTNFESAHNTDKDHLSHDTVLDSRTGRKISKSDSKWNFHVWNDVWMSRPDLDGKRYDGWQAIDATPQERSDGVFCCGPAPLTAIKEGDINIGFDTAFVFAEVNADMVTWEKNVKTGEMKVVRRNTSAVGKNMTTRKPRGSALEKLDVTDQYKYKEGSTKEREIVKKAEKMFRFDNLDPDDDEPVEKKALELKIQEQDDIYLGSGFQVVVMAKNVSDSRISINMSIKVLHKTYHGEITGLAAETSYGTEPIEGKSERPFTLDVPVKSTLTHPKDGFNFEIKAVAMVNDTEGIVLDSDSFRLRRPDVIISGPTSGRAGEEMDFEVSFTNPLPSLLTNVVVAVDGGLKPVSESIDEHGIKIISIKDGETWKTNLKMKATRVPRTSKERTASFSLKCDQLGGIIGTHTFSLR